MEKEKKEILEDYIKVTEKDISIDELKEIAVKYIEMAMGFQHALGALEEWWNK